MANLTNFLVLVNFFTVQLSLIMNCNSCLLEIQATLSLPSQQRNDRYIKHLSVNKLKALKPPRWVKGKFRLELNEVLRATI